MVVISNEFCIEVLLDFGAGAYCALIALLSCYLFGDEKSQSPVMMGTFMLRLRSNGTIMRQSVMRLPVLFVTYLAVWLGAELVAFAIVVHLIGFAGAILACILTSLAGLSTLRRTGLSAILWLRRAVARRTSEQSVLSRDAVLDGALAGLGAMLLILPGFVSDMVGLALAAPSVRFWVTERLKLGKFGRAAAPKPTELAPWEWSRRDGPFP
jgi:UPF0716 protein FxsA